jgi:hypothetical protein
MRNDPARQVITFVSPGYARCGQAAEKTSHCESQTTPKT